MPSRRKPSSPDDQDAPSFEESLHALEGIVEAMENEQLPLEELVAYYEKGSKLLDRCESVLDSAKARIELITVRQKNQSVLDSKAAADDSTSSAFPSGSTDDSDDDDIRLF